MSNTISSGLLANATPLSTEQIEELEKKALRTNQTCVFLNADNELSLIVPWGVEGLKDIAYENIYEIIVANGIITKNVYKKRGLECFKLTGIYCKTNLDDQWEIINIQDKVTLPVEYQQIEYIKGKANCFIDTGVLPTNNTSVDITYKTNNTEGSQYIFGARARASSDILYAINGSTATDYWTVSFGSRKFNVSFARSTDKINAKVSLVAGEGSIVYTNLNTAEVSELPVSNITIPTNPATLANFYLFAFNNSNIHGNLNIYRCKIYEHEELIRDFIPCYRKSDNVIGMYDTVTHKFYKNNGTGTFVAGPAIKKNILGLPNRTVINFGGSTNSTKRAFPGGNGIIIGLAANNYYYDRGELVSYNDLGFSFIPAEDWYGIGFDVKLFPNTTYKLSMDYNLGSPSTAIIQYDSQGNFLEYTMVSSSTTITTQSDTDWGVICFRNAKDTLIHIINPRLEAIENTTFDESQLEEPNQSLLDVGLLDEFILE